jgi:hypothetical protein
MESANQIQHLAARELIAVSSPMWRNHSSWLSEISSNVYKILNHVCMDKFSYVTDVLIPVVKDLFQAERQDGNTLQLPSDDNIYEAIVIMFKNPYKRITVTIGDLTNTTDYMQASADGRFIFINPAWACAANTSIEINPNSHESLLHRYQGCVKFLHELGHSFTLEMLDYLYNVGVSQFPTSTVRLVATPTKVGTKRLGNSKHLEGDMGYAIELHLTGRGRTFIGQTDTWEAKELSIVTCSSKTGKTLFQQYVFGEESKDIIQRTLSNSPVCAASFRWKETGTLSQKSRTHSSKRVVESKSGDGGFLMFGCSYDSDEEQDRTALPYDSFPLGFIDSPTVDEVLGKRSVGGIRKSAGGIM